MYIIITALSRVSSHLYEKQHTTCAKLSTEHYWDNSKLWKNCEPSFDWMFSVLWESGLLPYL